MPSSPTTPGFSNSLWHSLRFIYLTWPSEKGSIPISFRRNVFYIKSLKYKDVRRSRKDAQKSREIARERMTRLFELSADAHELHPDRSDRYVQIARQIGTRTRVRMPRHLKSLFCKHCGCYLPASGARTRLRDGVLTATCLRCGTQARRPYKGRRPISRD